MDLAQLAIIVVVALVNLGLALMVYLRNRRSASNRAFAAAVVAIVCWLTFAFLSNLPQLAGNALLLNRLTLASAMWMGGFLLRFALIFPSREGKLPLAWRLYGWFGLGLGAVTLLTPWVVADVTFRPGGTDIVAGTAFPLLVVWALTGMAGCVVALTRKYRASEGKVRTQLMFMLLGFAGFAVASVALGLIVPVVTGSYELAELNNFSSLVLVSIITYVIVKHRFMDLRLAVLRAATHTALLFAVGLGLVWIAFEAGRDLSTVFSIRPEALYIVGSLAAVFAFQPLRVGLQSITDRYFYRRSYRQSELLSRVSTSMNSVLDEHGLASLLAEELATGMRLGFAGVAYLHGGRPTLVSSGSAMSLNDAEMLLFMAGDSIVVTDEVEPGTPGHAELVERDIRVLAPLSSNDASLGVLMLGPKRSGESYSTQDVRFLEIVVAEAAISMRNAHLFDEKTQRVRELTALNELAFALGSSVEIDSVLDGALDKVVAVTGADAGSIMLIDESGECLTIAASTDIDEEIVASTRVPVGKGIAGWVARNNRPLSLPHAAHADLLDELLRDDISSAICAPVLSKDNVVGVLCVSRTNTSEEFTEENVHVVTSIAAQLGMAIENARLYGDLENTFLGTISALAAAVDAKDPYTAGHSNEVTTLAVALAEALNLDAAEVQRIRIASTLHDIGKIGIDGAILLKPGRLTDEEREIINRHPAIGADILAPLDFLRELVPYVLFHHERYGGGGYPSGVGGEAIPFGARIIAVADAFNAMVSDRPYREGLSLEAAMHEIRANSGTQFDPVVAEAFLKLLEEEAIATGRPELPKELPVAQGWRADKPLYTE